MEVLGMLSSEVGKYGLFGWWLFLFLWFIDPTTAG